MPASALALVILAGLIHACWNIVAKKVGGDGRFAFFTGALMMLVWAPLGLWQSWLQVPGWGWQAYAVVVVSGFLHVGYYLVLLRGYREADLTVVYPLARGSGPLLSSTMAILFLGEQLSALGGLGIAAVVGGVFLVAGGPSLFRAARDPASHRRVRAGVFYGLTTGVFIAGYTVVDGWGVKVIGMSPILVDYLGNLVRLVILVPLVLPQRAGLWPLFRQQWKGALLVAAISPVSYVLVLYALQLAPLSHVAPAREVSMLFAALIGGHLLAEGDRLLRVLGATCIAAGVMALALG
jgi:drug/metabolite transporter (DMT)-like permease